MKTLDRREALRLAGLGITSALAYAADFKDPQTVAKKPQDPFRGLKVGLASYSTRKLSVEQTIACCKRIGIRYITLKDFHCKMDTTREERQAVRKKFSDAGIEVVGCGVIYLKNDETEIRKALEYVRDLGANTAVVGCDAKTVPALEKVIKDFDIRAAIHNHGPEDRLGAFSPLDVMGWLKGVDSKIGLCLDTGHTFRCGVDFVAAARTCASRLYDVHQKDLDAATTKGKGVPMGQGVLDCVGFLRMLVKIKYAHHVALEYEVDADDPVPGIAESIGFTRGVLSSI